jgi:hypothetical protein
MCGDAFKAPLAKIFLTFKFNYLQIFNSTPKIKTPKTRIMIRKIVIRQVDKHNHPRGQTIYQINQRLFVALQQSVGE